ncbi:hypothetical protein HYQ44_011843 [Verticillium longisporum]|nr:hypothetical protein HYQ44_011843 [Verticillium longisporum]
MCPSAFTPNLPAMTAIIRWKTRNFTPRISTLAYLNALQRHHMTSFLFQVLRFQRNASTPLKTTSAVISKTRNKANFPLVCYLCDNEPKYSDVSHLLTHLLSRGHARAKGNIEVRSHIPGDVEAAQKFAAFQKWQDDNGIGALLSERFLDKNNKKKEKDRVEAAKRKRFLEQQRTSSKKRKNLFLPHIPTELMDDFNITPKSVNQDFDGLNPTGSLDRNVTPGFLAAQDLTYLGPVYSDYDNSRVSDYVDRSDMVSEYASDNDDNVRRVPELKGQYWPGMHLFDSATEEGKKKRNQRKDDSVIQRMRIGSDAINPTEMVTDMMMNFERYRHIDEDPSDDEVSPLKGSASKKKTFIHKPSVVPEHILKRRSKALATMGGRLSTPTKSTPRKSTPRKSTPRKYTPRKQAAVKTPSKKPRKARGQATTKVVADKEGTGERRPKRGSATRAKSRIAAQAEQAEHDMFDDRDSIDQEFEIDSPDETPIKTKFKKETARRTTRNDSLHASYKHSASSTVESTTVSTKNEHGVYQDDGANLPGNPTSGVAGRLSSDSRPGDAVAYNPHLDLGILQPQQPQQQPQGIMPPQCFAHGMHSHWAPTPVFNGFEPQVIPGHGMIQPRDFYQGYQHQSLPQSGHNQSSFYHPHPHPHQQSYAYPDPMFHDGMFQDRSGSVRSPQVITWNTANTNENTSIYGGQPWSVISAAERGYTSHQNTGWVDAGHATTSASAGVLSGGNLNASDCHSIRFRARSARATF